jgi:UDP-N-acetylglucosamine 2-epimerase
LGYLDMLVLERHARLILTDSGGVQKEAFFFAVPCLTLREETEWVETVEAGWNRLVGADPAAIVQAARAFRPVGSPPPLFGDGHAAERIATLLGEHGLGLDGAG